MYWFQEVGVGRRKNTLVIRKGGTFRNRVFDVLWIFNETWSQTLEFIWKRKDTILAKNILKKNNGEEFSLLNIKVCDKATVIKTLWFWYECMQVTSVMFDSATLWTVDCQTPLSIGFSRQEYWSGLPCPPPGDLPDPEIELESLMSPALAGGFFTTSATWKAWFWHRNRQIIQWDSTESPGIDSLIYVSLAYEWIFQMRR